LGTHWHL
jgi:hypothetical protein